MAKRTTKKALKPVRPQLGDGVEILNAGSVLEDPITRTLETNYMPYAMSVIVSRALPEIDGFKPAHRKLLYTMYGMGLLKGARTKSANIVGSTMHLNPHGDAAIYDTMVRMGRGNESLLVPYVDSKGNFGKAYSRDMSCAAARYTEAKLEGVCEELFRDIDRETVDFVPNYDGTTTEPTLLPVTFPTILANNTLGIAVGMACNICSFNLAELCNTTIALMKDPRHDISTTMPAPDFVGGGQILYDEAQMREIYENGRGSVRVRPFGLGPPEEAFQEAVPIRAEQPARTDDTDVVGVELKQGLFTGKAALAAQGDRIGLVLLGVRGVLAAVENLIRAVVDEESGRAFDQPAEEGRKAAVDREGFLWLFFSRVFRVPAYGIENDVRVDEFDARLEFYGIQEIAVFKIQRLRLPAVSGKLLRQRLAQKAVSAKNESDRSTHGFSP